MMLRESRTAITTALHQLNLLGHAEVTAAETAAEARGGAVGAEGGGSEAISVAVAREEQAWWEQEMLRLREGRERRGGKDGVGGGGERGGGSVAPGCEGWLGWWPLERASAASARSADLCGTDARTYVLPDAGPLRLHAQYLTPEWLASDVPAGSGGMAVGSSRGGAQVEFCEEREAKHVLVGSGSRVFVPLFACMGASAVTFCTSSPFYTIEYVLLLHNVFSCYRMCSLLCVVAPLAPYLLDTMRHT